MSKSLWDQKIDKMLREEKKYEFPKFVKSLRQNLGLKRTSACHDMGISYAILRHIELDKLLNVPRVEYLHAIAEFYDIPFSFLKRKAEQFYFEPERLKRNYYSRKPRL